MKLCRLLACLSFPVLWACATETAPKPEPVADVMVDTSVTADSSPDAAGADATGGSDAVPVDTSGSADAPTDTGPTADTDSVTGDDASAADASTADASNAADAGGGLLCGRYQVVEAGTGDPTAYCPGKACTGDGLVTDKATGLLWQRFGWLPGYAPENGQNHSQAKAFCGAKGMRLATLTEALDIAKPSGYCLAAFPEGVKTTTSTFTDASEDAAWFVVHTVDSNNHQMPVGANSDVRVMCVKGPPL